MDTTYVQPARAAWAHVRDVPRASSMLLFAVLVVYVAEWGVFFRFGVAGWERVFDLQPAWWTAPWAVILALLAHIPWPVWYHFLPNVVGLWILAPVVKRRVGGRWMLCLFFATGLVAEFVELGLTRMSTIGASGGIMGLWGWIVVDTWGPIHPFTGPPRDKWIGLARVGAVGMVVLSVLDISAGGSRTGDYAHMAGLLLGMSAGVVSLRTRKGWFHRGVT